MEFEKAIDWVLNGHDISGTGPYEDRARRFLLSAHRAAVIAELEALLDPTIEYVEKSTIDARIAELRGEGE